MTLRVTVIRTHKGEPVWPAGLGPFPFASEPQISVRKMVTLCGPFYAYFAILDVIQGLLSARLDSPCLLP